MRIDDVFMAGDTAIDLSRVTDVVQRPNPGEAEDVWLMVMMEDDTFTTLKGRAATEAFMQALDHHLGADLI